MQRSVFKRSGRVVITIVRWLLVVCLVAVCVSALSKTKSHETTSAAEKNAAKKCKEERGTTPSSIQAFKDKYGTNPNKANAFGKCVSQLAKAKSTS